jgi:hypothetical protein
VTGCGCGGWRIGWWRGWRGWLAAMDNVIIIMSINGSINVINVYIISID